MDNLKDSVDSDVDQKVPSYKDAIDEIKRVFSNMSDALGAVSNSVMTPAMQNDKLPKEFKAYLPDAVKRTDAAKKIVDDYLARIQKLPPVKQLDEFKQQLTSKSIIVEADDGYKIIPATQIWPPAERSNYAAPGEETHKYRFAGEQQVSMAISSLESPEQADGGFRLFAGESQFPGFDRRAGPRRNAARLRRTACGNTILTCRRRK